MALCCLAVQLIYFKPYSFSVLSAHFASGPAIEPIKIAYSGARSAASARPIVTADASGSYFDLNMNGLQTERYYTVLIKTTINNSTIVYNDNYSFKIING